MIELLSAAYAAAVLVCWVVLVRIDFEELPAGLHLAFAVLWPVFLVAWAFIQANEGLEVIASWIRGRPRRDPSWPDEWPLPPELMIRDRYEGKAAPPPQPASGAEGPTDDSGDLGSGKRLRDPVTGQQSVSAKGRER